MVSNKNFGYTFVVIFLVLSLFFLKSSFSYFLIGLSIILLLITIFIPRILNPLNRSWYRFGVIISKLMNPIILTIIYFFIFFPISILVKIFKKNYLEIKIDKGKNSYWLHKDKSNIDFKDQF